MRSKLYKLALWYIGKCNAKWDKKSYENKLKSLDRLTYWNFGKYMLIYGADAEWRIFSRYEVLDNAIQKLAQYEDDVFQKEIRNKAIDEFVENMEKWNNCIKSIRNEDGFFTIENIRKIAEQMKGE